MWCVVARFRLCGALLRGIRADKIMLTPPRAPLPPPTHTILALSKTMSAENEEVAAAAPAEAAPAEAAPAEAAPAEAAPAEAAPAEAAKAATADDSASSWFGCCGGTRPEGDDGKPTSEAPGTEAAAAAPAEEEAAAPAEEEAAAPAEEEAAAPAEEEAAAAEE